MKETIVKSIVSGVTFFMTVGLLFVAYASGAFNLPATAWTGSGLTATEWNKMVGSLDYLKTEIDTLKSKSPKTFIWATTLTYNGAWVGWYAGGDAKCAAQFGAGTRMCTGADFANTRPNVSGFYNTFTLASDGSGPAYDCGSWTFSSTQRIIFWDGTGPSSDPCSNPKKILCCQ